VSFHAAKVTVVGLVFSQTAGELQPRLEWRLEKRPCGKRIDAMVVEPNALPWHRSGRPGTCKRIRLAASVVPFQALFDRPEIESNM
jgi:hypothetical protein